MDQNFKKVGLPYENLPEIETYFLIDIESLK